MAGWEVAGWKVEREVETVEGAEVVGGVVAHGDRTDEKRS